MLNSGPANFKSCCKALVRPAAFAKSAKFPYLFPRHNSSWILFARSAFTRGSTLCLLVFHIIERCSKPQVIRSNTIWHIAAMKHLEFVRNSSVVYQPAYSVGVNLSATPATATKGPITASSRCSRPKPALLSLFYVFPKSFFDCLGKVFGCHDRIGMQWDSPSFVPWGDRGHVAYCETSHETVQGV